MAIQYFVEYVGSLCICSFVITFEKAEADTLKSFTDLHTDCFFVFPTNILMNSVFDCALQRNCCLCNTEQMSIDEWRKAVITFLQNGGRLINYSAENARLVSEHDGAHLEKQMLLLPYVCQDSECAFLSTLMATGIKLYDYALVVGNLSPRRRLVVDALTSNGMTVCVIQNCFGAERDHRIAQCRALLNVHANESYTVFESIRCNRWLAAGMTVISEQCSDASLSVPSSKNLFMASASELVDVCKVFTRTGQLPKQNSGAQIVEQDTTLRERKSLAAFNQWLGQSYLSQPANNGNIVYIYGARDRLINVTERARKVFDVEGDGSLHINANASFNTHFGDVCCGVEKQLAILFGEINITLPESRRSNYTIGEAEGRLTLTKK
jgi:hypothetical protein